MKTRHLLPVAVLFCISVFLFWNAHCPAEAEESMHGIYVLPAGRGLDGAAAGLDYVAGYSIRVSWKALEPKKGKYNWEPIDRIIKVAREKGKYVTLRIMAGVDSPNWVLKSRDIPKMTIISRNPNKERYFNKEVTLPKLWDEKYLNEYYRFLDAVAKRYSEEPLLYWVAVSGPVTGPACPMLPKDEETVRIFEKEGFTKDKWRTVWEEAIDRTALAFPKKAISVCLDAPPFYEELAGELASYAVGKYAGRACLQSNGLSAKVSAAEAQNPKYKNYLDIFRQYQGKATIGFQMAWAAAWKNKGRDRLGPLDQAVNAGIGLGASYLEIYQDDIIDPANEAILKDAATRLGAGPAPGAAAEGPKAETASAGPSETGKTKRDLKNIMVELELSSDQKTQVRDILQKARRQRVEDGQNVDREEIIERIRETLNETQRKEFDRLVSQ